MGMRPMFFVSVASKGLSDYISVLESTLTGISTSVDSKGTYVAPKLCRIRAFFSLLGSREGTRRERRDWAQKKTGDVLRTFIKNSRNTQGYYTRYAAGKQGK